MNTHSCTPKHPHRRPDVGSNKLSWVWNVERGLLGAMAVIWLQWHVVGRLFCSVTHVLRSVHSSSLSTKTTLRSVLLMQTDVYSSTLIVDAFQLRMSLQKENLPLATTFEHISTAWEELGSSALFAEEQMCTSGPWKRMVTEQLVQKQYSEKKLVHLTNILKWFWRL